METNRIIWYHGDWSKPTVMKEWPLPRDWGIVPYSGDPKFYRFMARRRRHVERLRGSLGYHDMWWGQHLHWDPLNRKERITVRPLVIDEGKRGVALLDSTDGQTSLCHTLVVYGYPRRLVTRESTMPRGVANISANWREALERELKLARKQGPAPVAFTIPHDYSEPKPLSSALHDYQRALIRAMVRWLTEREWLRLEMGAA